MTDLLRSVIEFQRRFGDEAVCAKYEAVCAKYLAATRWPNGFACPGCGNAKAWRMETEPWTYECATCGRQAS